MRVLHVIPSISSVHGGPSSAIAVLERALSAEGVMVTTATTDDDGPRRRLDELGRPATANGASRFYARKWLEFYKVAPGMVRWLWGHVRQFDVLHIHALFSFTSIAAAFIARIRGVPYVVRPLGSLNSYGVARRRPWLKRLSLALIEGPMLRDAAAVHFTSQAELEEATALGLRFHGVVIPLGVEPLERVDRQALLHEHRELEGRQLVLFLSRLDPVKNVEGLLNAFAELDPKLRCAALMIAGDGPVAYVEALKELGNSLRVADRITWLGRVEGAHKAAAFAAADVFVLPSISENFGIAAVEAMLAGLPCILSEGVAIAREVAAAKAGLAVAPQSDCISKALVALLTDEPRRVEMGIRARYFAERAYSSSTIARRLISLYRDVADGKEFVTP